jgi:hypothetical protein
MKHAIAAVLVSLVVSGCVTAQDYNKDAKSWVGRTSKGLIQSWGPPKIRAAGGKALIYTFYQGERISRASADPSWACQVIFEVENGVISEYQTSGKGC